MLPGLIETPVMSRMDNQIIEGFTVALRSRTAAIEFQEGRISSPSFCWNAVTAYWSSTLTPYKR
jgi:hypothetical protein